MFCLFCWMEALLAYISRKTTETLLQEHLWVANGYLNDFIIRFWKYTSYIYRGEYAGHVILQECRGLNWWKESVVIIGGRIRLVQFKTKKKQKKLKVKNYVAKKQQTKSITNTESLGQTFSIKTFLRIWLIVICYQELWLENKISYLLLPPKMLWLCRVPWSWARHVAARLVGCQRKSRHPDQNQEEYYIANCIWSQCSAQDCKKLINPYTIPTGVCFLPVC